MLPAQRRPPERTWWTQILNEGRGVEPPMELDESQLVELAGSVDSSAGTLPPDSLAVKCKELAPSVLVVARLCQRIDLQSAPARPVYVRAPDAAPMKPPSRERSD